MRLTRWYVHQNGTPLLNEWFPMAGKVYYEADEVRAWLQEKADEQRQKGQYERSLALYTLVQEMEP